MVSGNCLKLGDALAGQIVVDSSDRDARITLQVKNTIPSYTLRGYLLRYADGDGVQHTVQLPPMEPGSHHTFVLKNINARYAFYVERPGGFSVISY